MPKRNAEVLITDILAALDKIERYIQGMNRETFLADEKTVDAVVRNLEIVGEAVRQDLAVDARRPCLGVLPQLAPAPE